MVSLSPQPTSSNEGIHGSEASDSQQQPEQQQQQQQLLQQQQQLKSKSEEILEPELEQVKLQTTSGNGHPKHHRCSVHPPCLFGSTISSLGFDAFQLQKMYCLGYYYDNNQQLPTSHHPHHDSHHHHHHHHHHHQSHSSSQRHHCRSTTKLNKWESSGGRGNPGDVTKPLKPSQSPSNNTNNNNTKVPVLTAGHHINKVSTQSSQNKQMKGTAKYTGGSIGLLGHYERIPRLTPYESILKSLNEDERWERDITLGKRIGFYKFKNDIGTGNFSQVKVATHQLTREKVAIKILDRSKLDAKMQKMLGREIASMEKLHHPNVVRLFEVIETFSKIYLVMEFANGGELYQKITTDGKMDEDQAKSVFAQIVSAVDHMHQHNIFHRDIKAENIFLTDANIVKVGDFGFSVETTKKDDLLNTFCGSPPYAAPELFSDDKYSGPYVDLWALGVLLYFMVTSFMPFTATTVAQLKKRILEGDYTLPTYLSSSCQSIIRGLLKNEPSERFKLSQILTSDWLKNQQFPECLPTNHHSLSTESNVSELDQDLRTIPMKIAYFNDVTSSPKYKDKSKGLLQLSKQERETYRLLNDLGINEKMVKEAGKKGIRSNITGTYNILLNRVMSNRTAHSLVEAKVKNIGTQTKESSFFGPTNKHQLQHLNELQQYHQALKQLQKQQQAEKKAKAKSKKQTYKESLFVQNYYYDYYYDYYCKQEKKQQQLQQQQQASKSTKSIKSFFASNNAPLTYYDDSILSSTSRVGCCFDSRFDSPSKQCKPIGDNYIYDYKDYKYKKDFKSSQTCSIL